MKARRQLPIHRSSRSPRSRILLNVKMRAVTARQRRKKMAWGFATIAIAVTLGCGTLWFSIGLLLDHFFYSNPTYTLREIVLDLDGTMDSQSALEKAGISEGTNIFTVDIAGAAARLGSIPSVADVEISRHLPDRLEIRVAARDPVARIGAATGTLHPLLVDDSGFTMRPATWTTQYDQLPHITGAPVPEAEGVLVKDQDFQTALQLLREARRQGDFQIATLDLSKDYCLDAVALDGAKIRFAPEDFPEQLLRLAKLLAHCRETGRQLESVNLMVRKNTPVKFVMNTPPLETAETPRKTRNLPN
jgi:cell division septal protein FtsQ